MKKTKIKGLEDYARGLKKSLTECLIESQTRALLSYAEKKIKELGDKILTFNSKNNMDRTGNLLNSLCWCLTYRGELKGSGFYRDAVYHNKGKYRTSESYLHEFWGGDLEIEINGREEAEVFLEREGKVESSGWRLVFAILAPYWGYWESGFTLVPNIGNGSPRFFRFAVMSEFYDEVTKELKPAKVSFTVSEVTKSSSSSKRAHTKEKLKKLKDKADRDPYDYTNIYNTKKRYK